MTETPPAVVRPFTVTMDYFATGEGLTYALAVVQARDTEGAKAAFLDAHGYFGSSRDYFGRGVYVHEGVDRARLGRWLTPQFIDTIERQMHVHAQFKFHWHFNAS
ncbi:hypothetical protein E7T06_18525 [Deinococcus sp. Arct2-2]|uniref:hypothetical protein n=1 Tax=Deinococcus sp. Arct2-2 TaxID=2568653 RepID=UPI0010A392B3|nr:hypothetical protein [Deinococcus sp. Arct2-2]THF68033.1 hypothetical protein E7T06_18525 [Deinococcus sp. Arct2-2]